MSDGPRRSPRKQGVSTGDNNGTGEAVGFGDRDDERPEWFDRVSAAADTNVDTDTDTAAVEADKEGEHGGNP